MEQKVFHFYISIHIPSVQPEFSSVPGCTLAVSGRTFRYIGKCNFALSAVLCIIQIEQNRCAMACQGCDAVFLFLNKKQWKPSPNSSIVKSPQPTIKQDRHYHCL